MFGPTDPIKTAELILKRPDIINIMGNCDRYLLQEQMESVTFHYVKPVLTPEIHDWIQSFKKTWVFEDLLFCHGTPFADDEYLLEEVTTYGVIKKMLRH